MPECTISVVHGATMVHCKHRRIGQTGLGFLSEIEPCRSWPSNSFNGVQCSVNQTQSKRLALHTFAHCQEAIDLVSKLMRASALCLDGSFGNLHVKVAAISANTRAGQSDRGENAFRKHCNQTRGAQGGNACSFLKGKEARASLKFNHARRLSIFGTENRMSESSLICLKRKSILLVSKARATKCHL